MLTFKISGSAKSTIMCSWTFTKQHKFWNWNSIYWLCCTKVNAKIYIIFREKRLQNFRENQEELPNTNTNQNDDKTKGNDYPSKGDDQHRDVSTDDNDDRKHDSSRHKNKKKRRRKHK